MRRKGPSEMVKTRITVLASERKRDGRSSPDGDRQKERSK